MSPDKLAQLARIARCASCGGWTWAASCQTCRLGAQDGPRTAEQPAEALGAVR